MKVVTVQETTIDPQRKILSFKLNRGLTRIYQCNRAFKLNQYTWPLNIEWKKHGKNNWKSFFFAPNSNTQWRRCCKYNRIIWDKLNSNRNGSFHELFIVLLYNEFLGSVMSTSVCGYHTRSEFLTWNGIVHEQIFYELKSRRKNRYVVYEWNLM